MSSFFKGVVIGFSIAAPVGPIGLLCLRRSLAEGRWAGFVSGLGAATADGIYGLVAALGFSTLAAAWIDQAYWLHLAGACFLVYLGVTTAMSSPTRSAAETTASSGLAAAYWTTFALTLTNPMTILAFAGIIAAVSGPSEPASSASAVLLVSGVFSGSAAWWLILSQIAGLRRVRYN